MRYAQRAASPAQSPSADTANPPDNSLSGAAYSVVSREQKLKIVGSV